MAITPIFASSCDLAERLPVMIAEFLDIEQKLKRRFREDSVTDILVASLLSLPGNGVVVLTPPGCESRCHIESVDGSIILIFGFSRRGVADGLQQPTIVEPVDPFERGIFDGLERDAVTRRVRTAAVF